MFQIFATIILILIHYKLNKFTMKFLPNIKKDPEYPYNRITYDF